MSYPSQYQYRRNVVSYCFLAHLKSKVIQALGKWFLLLIFWNTCFRYLVAVEWNSAKYLNDCKLIYCPRIPLSSTIQSSKLGYFGEWSFLSRCEANGGNIFLVSLSGEKKQQYEGRTVILIHFLGLIKESFIAKHVAVSQYFQFPFYWYIDILSKYLFIVKTAD